MTPLHSFESAFARDLQKRIDAEIQQRALTLVRGGALAQSDVNGTALNYAESIAYVRALEHVLEWCKDVEDELTGRAAAKRAQIRGTTT